MELGLKDKHVIDTGGGTNIGRAIVHAFGTEGSKISIAELVPSQGEIVAGEVAAMNTGAVVNVIPTDVTDPERVSAMIDQAIAEFGPVDVLVNNVGWTVDRLFIEKPRHEWEREVQVNLWGAINCIHAVLPGMIERQSGAIVCISSDAGRMGEYREAVYSACKAGIIGLCKSLARENARFNINVNAVAPGPTETPLLQAEIEENPELIRRMTRLIPFRKVAQPEDQAGAISYLISDDAAYITGQVISVSGGLTMVD